MIRYTSQYFIDRGIYAEKFAGEDIDIPEGGKSLQNLSQKIRSSLAQVGGNEFNGDKSRQDSSVITAMLVAGHSPEDVYATFADSKRGRDAAERHPQFDDYLNRTIKKAVSFLNRPKSNGHRRDESKKEETETTIDESSSIIRVDFSRKRKEFLGEGIITERASESEVDDVHWLWDGYIPLGKLTVLAGDPGMGKSTIALDIVSRITQGTVLPTGERSVKGTCILASAEDAASDTIVPRLIAAEADRHRVEIIRKVRIDDEEAFLSFPRDLERLRTILRQTGARAFVIDPFNAFVEKGTDTYKDQDVRLILSGMEDIANETGTAILIVAHLTKKEDATTLYRVGGSIGFIGAARSVLAVTETPKTRVLYSLKTNLGKKPSAIAYDTRDFKRVRKDESEWKGAEKIHTSRIKWMGKISFDPISSGTNSKSKSDREARDFLTQVLMDSEMCTEDLFSEAKKAGVSVAQLKEVRIEMGIQSKRKRDMRWYWKKG